MLLALLNQKDSPRLVRPRKKSTNLAAVRFVDEFDHGQIRRFLFYPLSALRATVAAQVTNSIMVNSSAIHAVRVM
jgi:hypothetical protein